MDKTDAARAKASSLRAEGFSYEKIGDHLGVSRQRAIQLVHEHDSKVEGMHCELCGGTGMPIHHKNGVYACVKCVTIPK
jgi:hypothetical protein